MNEIYFQLEDSSYIVELSKEPRQFGYSEFGQYICHMKFLDRLGISQVVINGNEKQFTSFMNILNDFNMFPDEYYNCIAYFDIGNVFAWISSNHLTMGPSEEDEKLFIQFFQDTIQGRTSLIYLEFNVYELENLIYNLYTLLEDIPYLKDIMYSSLLETMGEYDMEKVYGKV